MKILTYVVIMLVAVNASLLKDADIQFPIFKITYEKFYRNPAEESKRFSIFKDNLKIIEEHNNLYEQGLTTWKKGITKYTDWTQAEFESMLALQKSSLVHITGASKLEDGTRLAVPDAIDWREKGQVTEVRDQGACASSWAFSIAGSAEALHYRKTGELVALSPQQLVDCSSEIGNTGCSGGYLHETMPYLQWHGLESEEKYPYQGKDGDCQFNASDVLIKIDAYKSFWNNQYQLEQVVGNIGPVSAGIDATELKDYKSGIYDSTNCEISIVNLALVVVGYGSENGTNYWIVKNCYGKNWGEDGYIRVIKKGNHYACGLYRDNVYPIIY